MHEIALNVQLENITRAGVIARNLPDLLFQAKDAVIRPPTFYAGIAVTDELNLQDSVNIIVQQMMDHAVTEHGRKNLSHLGIVNNETLARARFVSTGKNGIPKANEVPLKIALEAQLVPFAPFMATGIPIGPEQVQ